MFSHVFVDVDAMCKLAHWQILGLLPQLLNVQWRQCSTLSSTKFRAIKAQTKLDGRVFHSPQAPIAVLEAMREMAPVIAIPPEGVTGFQDIVGIDPGEAILLAALQMHNASILLTGDKRALRTLSSLPGTERQPYAGRIMLIEQIVLMVLDTLGLSWLQASLCPWRQVDKAIAMAMGSRCDLAEVAVREGLHSCIHEIAHSCDPTLIHGWSRPEN